MSYSDPSAGRMSMSIGALLDAARTWDLYDNSIDQPHPMPWFYTGARYENWWGSGVKFDQLHGLVKEHGIPVAWVPPADVLRLLVAAPDSHDAKLDVLVAAEADIRQLCHQRVTESDHDWLEDYPRTARLVMAAWDDGHVQAAACLALAGAEDLMFRVARVDRSKNYHGLTEEARREPSDWLPHLQLLLTPINTLFTSYFAHKNDPIPANLSRHAVLHTLPLDHLNHGHSIVAIMLLISLLRQAQQDAMESSEEWFEPE
ncbi:hypothetical protein [Kitasatospora indigofera]|uniref:hypothetical protein n=1 Tax=Kitasatospora indigofera TaxID=67307 RepID=UPI0033B5234E